MGLVNQDEVVQAKTLKKGVLYSAPGEEGSVVVKLKSGQQVQVIGQRRDGRWARVRAGAFDGFIQTKKLQVHDVDTYTRLDDYWGYTGFREADGQYITGHTAKPRNEVIEVHKDVDVDKAPEAPVASEVLERLAIAVEQKEPVLPEPSRSRFAFFDRFCSWRESQSGAAASPNEYVTRISEARYAFASTTVRWAAGAVVAIESIPYITGIFKNFAG